MTTPTTDPVCGMSVHNTELSATYAGQTYRFCSTACHDRFEADPPQFVPTTTVTGA